MGAGIFKRNFIKYYISVAFSFPPFFVSSVKITSGDGRFSTVSDPSAEGFTAYGRWLMMGGN
jgi:hypothetical protein